jgi:hypothetical protein
MFFLGLISTCLSFSWIMLILYLFNMSIAYYLIDNALLYWNSLQSSNLIHISVIVNQAPFWYYWICGICILMI